MRLKIYCNLHCCASNYIFLLYKYGMSKKKYYDDYFVLIFGFGEII